MLTLCYHAIADLGTDPVLAPFGIAPKAFARQLDSLATAGCRFVSGDEVARWLAGEASLPARAVLLTFDDGYADLAEIVPAILAPRKIPAIVFAVADDIGGSNRWDQPAGAGTRPLLDASGLAGLRKHAIEIGCHSASHVSLPGLPAPELLRQTRDAATAIASTGLPRPRFFAYPFGHYDAASAKAVEQAGFTAAFALRAGATPPSGHRFALARTIVLADDGPARFWLKTRVPRVARGLQALRRKTGRRRAPRSMA